MTGRGTDWLSALDVAFLRMDREGLPLHIGSVAVFDGAALLGPDGQLRLDEIRAQVHARLDDLPRLRRHVSWPPLGVGPPHWSDHNSFDVADHVEAVELPAGSDLDELRHHAERLIAQRLPMDRPLWHLQFVTGLADGKIGLIERVHHALVDGVAGVEVATVLLDLSPDLDESEPSRWRPMPDESPVVQLAGSLWETAAGPLRAASTTVRSMGHASRAVRSVSEAIAAGRTVLADGLLAPSSSLNGPVGDRRRLEWLSCPLDEIQQAGRPHGATANDVVLAAVAHGLRRLLLTRGEMIHTDDELKVLVPVSLRSETEHGALGNQVGALIVPLPIGIGDPTDRLTTVTQTTQRIKGSNEATITHALLDIADLLPAPLVGPLAHLTDIQRSVNIVVTNVPGPPGPLYCRGARMLEAYPYVPLGANMSIGVAVLSYDGELTIGLCGDADIVEDLGVLRDGIEDGFCALSQSGESGDAR